MRRLALALLTFSLLTPAAFAATEEERAALREQCMKSLNITEHRLRNGVFVEKLNKCVDIESRTLDNVKKLEELKQDRQDQIAETSAKYLLRLRGKAPQTVQRMRGKTTSVKRTTTTRPSPRTQRQNARDQGAVSGPKLKTNSGATVQ